MIKSPTPHPNNHNLQKKKKINCSFEETSVASLLPHKTFNDYSHLPDMLPNCLKTIPPTSRCMLWTSTDTVSSSQVNSVWPYHRVTLWDKSHLLWVPPDIWEGLAVTTYCLWNRPGRTRLKQIAQTNCRDMYTWILAHRAFYTLDPWPPISVKRKCSWRNYFLYFSLSEGGLNKE